ncbi:MAG: hypothetical protein KAT35_05220, partial [Candidatus Aenigmarchaeota archaeon]|nr:hypothetical protein [Candidatus Aenigmarchaeota archaeon]
FRQKFVNTETDLMGRDMKKQLAYVNSQGIRSVIFVGPHELKKGRFTLRDMKTGREAGLTRLQLLNRFGKHAN